MKSHVDRASRLDRIGAPAAAQSMAMFAAWESEQLLRSPGFDFLCFCKLLVLAGNADVLMPELAGILAVDGDLPAAWQLPVPNLGAADPLSPGLTCDCWESSSVEGLTPWIASRLPFSKVVGMADQPWEWCLATPQMKTVAFEWLPYDGALWRARLTKQTDFGMPLSTSLICTEAIDITAHGETRPDGSGFRRFTYTLYENCHRDGYPDVLEDSGWIEMSGDDNGTQLRIQKRVIVRHPCDAALRNILSIGFAAELWMWASGFYVAQDDESEPAPKPTQPLHPQKIELNQKSAKVAVLGAGPAGLACAWLLSNPTDKDTNQPAWTSKAGMTLSVELFDKAYLPGGKAASARDVTDDAASAPIQEHGLHVLMGCYDNLLGMLRNAGAGVDVGVDADAGAGAGLLVPSSSVLAPTGDPVDLAQAWLFQMKPWTSIPDWREFWKEFTSTLRQKDALPSAPRVLPAPPVPRGVPRIDFTLKDLDRIDQVFDATPGPRLLMRLLVSLGGRIASLKAASAEADKRSGEEGIPTQLDAGGVPVDIRVVLFAMIQRIICLLFALDLTVAWSMKEPKSAPVVDLQHDLAVLGRLLRVLARSAFGQADAGTDDRIAAELVELGSTIIIGLGELQLFPVWAITNPNKLQFDPDYADWVRRLQSLDTKPLDAWLDDNGIAKGFSQSSPLLASATAALFTTPSGIGAGTFIHGLSRLLFTYTDAPFKRMEGGTGEAVIAPLYKDLLSRGVTFNLGAEVTGLSIDEKRRAQSVQLKRDAAVPSTFGQYGPQSRPGWKVPPPYTPDVGPEIQEQANYFVLAIPPFQQSLSGLPDALAKRLAQIGSRETVGLQYWTQRPPLYPQPILSSFESPLRCAATMFHLQGDEGTDFPQAPVYYCGDFDDGQAQAWADATSAGWLKNWAPSMQGGDSVGQLYLSVNDKLSARYVCADVATQAVRPYFYDTGVSNLLLAGDWTKTAFSCGSIEAAVTSGLEAARDILESLGCDVSYPILGSLLGPHRGRIL